MIPEVEDAELVGHSEEHLLVSTAKVDQIAIGQPLLVFPRHVCPTVALHAFATVVDDNVATTQHWRVTARDRG